MIKVGLIGHGNYGKRYYDNLVQDQNFKIIKVLIKSKKKNNNLFTNNKKNFFKIKNIDLYIIASPTNTHYEYLKHIVDKKKHMIIEKPLVSKLNQFLEVKNIIKNYKKIILINHTDLYMNGYAILKKKIKNIGKIKSVKLFYGKIDPYPIMIKNNILKLPHFEWLPHPIAVIIDLFKDQNYKIKLSEKKNIYRNKLLQNLKVNLLGKKNNIVIYFSNNYRNKKRNLHIYGSRAELIYKGYSKNKLSIKRNKNTTFFKTQDTDPIKNILKSFKLKYAKKKYLDDKRLILTSTKYLFKISDHLKNK